MSAPIVQSIHLKNTNIIVNVTLSGVQTVRFDPVDGQDLDYQPPAERAFPPPNFDHVVFQEVNTVNFDDGLPNNGPDFVQALIRNLEADQYEPVIIPNLNVFYQQRPLPAQPAERAQPAPRGLPALVPLHAYPASPPHFAPASVEELDPLDEAPNMNFEPAPAQSALAQPVVPVMPLMPLMPLMPIMPLMPVMPVMPAMPAVPTMSAVPAVPALPLPDLQHEVVRRPQPKKFPRRASKAARSQAWKALMRKWEISFIIRMARRRSFGYSSRFQKPYKPRRDRSPTMPASAIVGTAQNPIDLTIKMEEEEE